MNKILVLVVLLSTSVVYAKPVQFDAERIKQLKHLAQKVCYSYMMGTVGVAKQAKKMITIYMRIIDQITNPTSAQMLMFLNQNKQHMVCIQGDRSEKNYMKVAFDRGAHSDLFEDLFYDDLMLKESDGAIDVNAVSYTGPNKSPETVLDYMERIIEERSHHSGIIREIKELRDMFLIDLNAKRFHELSQETKKALLIEKK